MTFSIQNWARKSVSANEPLATVVNSAGTTIAQPGCFREYMYFGITYTNGVVTGDSFATMLSANYFNDVAHDLQSGDLIRVCSASQLAYLTLQVTSVSAAGVVTVYPLGQSGGFDYALSADEIKSAFTTPILMLPAPGANYAYVIRNWYIAKVAGGAAYTAGGDLNLYYDNTRTTAAAVAIPEDVIKVAAGAAGLGSAGALAAFGTASALKVNAPVYLSNITADFATGTATATVYINFEMVAMS